jgi:hypothetical protein
MSFEGEIGEIDLIDKLVELGRENFTGAIRFENDSIIKIVYFKTGDILSASTNDRADSIDEILLRAGKVTREHVKQALSKRKESETLGDALLGLGFITRKELTWARRAQAIGILRSLRSWEAGQYTIVADYLPKREEGTLFPLPQILVELIVTETDRARFDRATDGGSALFSKAPGFDEAFRRLGLNQDAEEIAAQIDGRNSAADVANAAGKDAFNLYKLLEALRALGLLVKGDKPQVTSEVGPIDDFAGAGVADAADMWATDTPQQFDLDDAPAVSFLPAAPAAAMPEFSWEQESVAEAPAPETTIPLPAWDAKPLVHDPVPEDLLPDEPATMEIPAVNAAPPPIAPPGPRTSEPAWGFDEAQIETARRAAVPLRSNDPVPATAAATTARPKPRTGISGALLTVLFLVIGGTAGWYGYNWWSARNAPTPSPAPVRRPRPILRPQASVPPLTAATATNVTTSTSATGTTGTTSSAPNGSMAVTTSATRPAAPAGSFVITPTATAATSAPAVVRKNPPPPARPPAATPPAAAHLERPAGGNPIITNGGTAAVPATSADPARARYDEQARQHATSAAAGYAVQFELVCETASLSKAIAAGGDKVWFTPTSYRGRSCYRVFWGRYATAAEAKAGLAEIPAALREGSSPAVVRTGKP